MTEEEYRAEIIKIFDELHDREDEIYQEAKKSGNFELVLDGNKHLFDQIKHEFHQKHLKLKEEYESQYH